MHVPTSRKGSDTCSLGLLLHRISSFAFPVLSLCLAQPPALYPSLSPSIGSLGQFLPCMWRSDLYHEEITFAAMRRGYDGIPIYLSRCPGATNMTVAPPVQEVAPTSTPGGSMTLQHSFLIDSNSSMRLSTRPRISRIWPMYGLVRRLYSRRRR